MCRNHGGIKQNVGSYIIINPVLGLLGDNITTLIKVLPPLVNIYNTKYSYVKMYSEIAEQASRFPRVHSYRRQM